MFHRILRGDDQERLRQFIGVCINGDLAFVHGLEQGGLRLGRGAVDLVREQDVGEYRTALEFELLFSGRKDRNAHNIGGQHVAGELHALEGAIDGARECLTKCGFADSRNTFDQQMPAGKDADQREADHIVFAANHAA